MRLRYDIRQLRSLVALASLALPAQASIEPSPDGAPDGSVMAAWTQITGNSSASSSDPMPLSGVARFVIQGATESCSDFSLATQGGGSAKAAFAARFNPENEKFPITVCETDFDPEWTSAVLQRGPTAARLWSPTDGDSTPATGPTVELPTLYRVGRTHPGVVRMAVYGDTGCRDNDDQSCSTTNDWPFKSLADQGVGDDPDFVIHVGDYRYSNKGHSDQWDYWYEEFFYPAQNLLLAAPWAPSRGNHEACGYDGSADKAAPWGTGWFYLLQHETIATSVTCTSAQPEYRPPWYFDVGVKSDSANGARVEHPQRFIMMDSSEEASSSLQVKNFVSMIDLSNAEGVDSTWWVGHQPFWGVYNFQGSLQADLETAIQQVGGTSGCWPQDNLPCSLKTVLAGHIHLLETASFYDPENQWLRPQQVVVGNSGVALLSGFPSAPYFCTYDALASTTQLVTTLEWDTSFGYVVWDRPAPAQPSGWKAVPRFMQPTHEGPVFSGATPPARPPKGELEDCSDTG